LFRPPLFPYPTLFRSHFATDPSWPADLAMVSPSRLAELEDIRPGADLDAVAAEAVRIAERAAADGDEPLRLRALLLQADVQERTDRKSTRLNSSHSQI